METVKSVEVGLATVPALNEAKDGERVLLEGPHSRLKELRLVLRVAWEFIAGFRTLHFVGPCVTVFGSARFGESHPYYALGREVGRGLARLGFTVMTGGGPGVMEAANRGAREAGGRSVGCNIELPKEQAPNPFLDRWVLCRYFFVRKVLLFKYSYAFRSAGWAGHTRRADRSTHAGPNGKDSELSHCSDRHDLLEAIPGGAL